MTITRCSLVLPVVLVLTIPMLTGCLGPDVPQGPEGFHTILIETGYDASERPDARQRSQDKAVDLPPSSPAGNLEVALGIEPGPAYDGESWEYDEPCPWRDGPHGGYADCSDHDRKDSYVLPSPGDAENYTQIRYVLDGNGTVAFFIPQPVEILVRVSDEYTEDLRDQAEDPDRCEEWPKAGSSRDGIEVEGAVEPSRETAGWFLISGDAKLSIPWYGVCPDGASS